MNILVVLRGDHARWLRVTARPLSINEEVVESKRCDPHASHAWGYYSSMAKQSESAEGYFLQKYLVLPLLVSAAITMYVGINVIEPWKSLCINVTAAFLGSVVTVFYVDRVLKRHQDAVWSTVRSKVLIRLESVANATISSVRTSFGIEPPDLPYDPIDFARMRQEMLHLAEQRLIPAREHIQSMDQSAWRTFVLNLQGSAQEVDRLLTLFWRNLDASQTALLLQLQEDAQQLLIGYSIWPDILGVPEHLLPKKRDGSSSVPLQRAQNSLASKNIETLLQTCARLLRSLPPQLGPE